MVYQDSASYHVDVDVDVKFKTFYVKLFKRSKLYFRNTILLTFCFWFILNAENIKFLTIYAHEC